MRLCLALALQWLGRAGRPPGWVSAGRYRDRAVAGQGGPSWVRVTRAVAVLAAVDRHGEPSGALDQGPDDSGSRPRCSARGPWNGRTVWEGFSPSLVRRPAIRRDPRRVTGGGRGGHEQRGEGRAKLSACVSNRCAGPGPRHGSGPRSAQELAKRCSRSCTSGRPTMSVNSAKVGRPGRAAVGVPSDARVASSARMPAVAASSVPIG